VTEPSAAAHPARAAEAAWSDRVRANREQVDRVREVPDGADFYARVTSLFRADPHRVDDAVVDLLRTHARPDDTWLDIGAGGGRYALPLALAVR
jgi:ubiquinone/menaquinone biosynthesis C-methylase UbiE